jgi:hypothetical protein
MMARAFLAVNLLTAFFQSWRAATENPVNSIKNEQKSTLLLAYSTYTPTRNPLYLLIYSRLRNISYTL